MTDAQVHIRRVTEKDIPELVAISRQTFSDAFLHLNNAADVQSYMDDTYTVSNLRQELQQEGSAFYFAEFDKRIAGYLKLNTGVAQTENEASNAMEVQRIYVYKDFQGQRIGERLIQFAIQQALEQRCPYTWLGVWEHNVNAIRFYQRQGFEIFSQHDFLLGADLQTDLLMKKILSY
ncbi:N-acetyltransferase [Mucilaginibacter koreensis]